MNTKLVDAFCNSVRPPAKLHPADWIAKNVYVARAGAKIRYSNLVTPWWRDIYAWLPDNNLKGFCVVASPGLGKSTLIEASIAYVVSEETGNILFAAKNGAALTDELDGGIIPTLENCEPIAPLMPQSHTRRKEMIRLAHKIFYGRPANEAGLQEVSVRWIFGDECWQWDYAQAFEHLNSRRHDRWNARTMLFAQASDYDSNWHKQCEIGDQYKWAWSCTKCGRTNPWKWSEQMKFETCKKGTAYDWDAIKPTVHIICPNCETEYADSDFNRRLLSDNSTYFRTERRDSGWRTAYIPAMAKYSIPWFELVKQFLRAQQQLKRGQRADLKSFLTQRLVEWDNPRRERSSIQRSTYSMADYAAGEKWEREHCRVMTIDKQASGYWAVVRAWAVDGESRGLWAGQIATETQLDALQKQYSVPSQWVYMDASYLPTKVAEICLKRGWCAIRGDKGAIRGYRVKSEEEDGATFILYVNPELTEIDAGGGNFCPEIVIASEPISDILDSLRNRQGALWEIPRDFPEEYFIHMSAEEKTLKNGKWKWEEMDRENHLWDCEKYQTGFAVLMGIFGIRGETDTGEKARG